MGEIAFNARLVRGIDGWHQKEVPIDLDEIRLDFAKDDLQGGHQGETAGYDERLTPKDLLEKGSGTGDDKKDFCQ
jgi:hypothetical protein